MLLVDALVWWAAVGLAFVDPAGLGPAFASAAWPRWGLLAHALVVLPLDLASLLRGGRAATWRGRLGFVAVVAVLWQTGPYGEAWLPPLAILATGWTWIALLLLGRRRADPAAHA
jgi:hypothetical protein